MTIDAPAPVNHAGGHEEGFAQTLRTDRWWLAPFLTILGLGSFIIYSTWAALQGEHYWAGSYLSPLYSPPLFVPVGDEFERAHSWFGAWPSWWPSWLPQSPALFILVFPGAFRATCYYYRKAYYRSFFGTPAGCAVCPVKQKNYRGESRLFLFQNLHRYALYFAVIFIGILTYDAIISLWCENPQTGQQEFGIGVGSLVLFLNAILLGAYTFGCHSWRHLLGGRLDRFSPAGRPLWSYHIWRKITWLNERHMLFAWLSLIWVGFTDFYVRMVSLGHITDLNTWKFNILGY